MTPRGRLSMALGAAAIAASLLTSCDEPPTLPEASGIEQELEGELGETVDAASQHRNSIQDSTNDMKKRLEPDAG